ncbi:MAG: amidase family protein, partial [Akkermansia sp.]
MLFGTITHWRAQLQSGAISPAELVEELDKAIAAHDPQIHAYLSRDKETALQAAARADLSLPLGGIPLAIKDNICVLGEPARCASKMLENFVSPYDATAVVRLRAAGAI